jgi:Tol biopolymer transport system component
MLMTTSSLSLRSALMALLMSSLAACGGGGSSGTAPAQTPPVSGTPNASRSGTLVYSYINKVYAVDMKTGLTRTLLTLDYVLSFVGAGVGPNGEFALAYNSSTTGPTSRLIILKADGTVESNTALNYTIQGQPRFSADGSKIAFLAGVYKGGVLDYSAQVVARTGENLYYYGAYEVPFWLPDGRLVLSRSDGLYVNSADINVAPTLIPNSQNISRFAVSPDGTKIAFVPSAATNAPRHVYMMGIDGSATRQITTSTNSEETKVVFSPDGKELLLTSYGCITVGPVTAVGSIDDDLMHVIPADSSLIPIADIRNIATTALKSESGQARCTSGTLSWR